MAERLFQDYGELAAATRFSSAATELRKVIEVIQKSNPTHAEMILAALDRSIDHVRRRMYEDNPATTVNGNGASYS